MNADQHLHEVLRDLMKKDLSRKSWQSAICLLCVILLWRYANDLKGTEFSGGWITGPLLDMKDVGTLLFIASLLLTFLYRRVAAGIMLVASVLCLPLCLYFIAPRPFRWVFRGEYSVPAPANFVWSKWGVARILALVMAACLGVRNLLGRAEGSSSTAVASQGQPRRLSKEEYTQTLSGFEILSFCVSFARPQV